MALRGPWSGADLVKIGPTAKDLAEGLYRVPPRLPGRRAPPGLRLPALGAAHHRGPRADGVRARRHRSRPSREARAPVLVLLRLQRLEQPARGRLGDDPARLRRVHAPRRRSSGRRSRSATASTRARSGRRWGDDEARARRRHASRRAPGRRFARELLRRGALPRQLGEEGVGCDDTRGPHLDVRPVVRTIPSGSTAGAGGVPWIAFEGRWGELQPAFFNGPTGPNLKTQWTHPIAWSEDWRDAQLHGAGRQRVRAERRRTSSAARSARVEGLVQLVRSPVEFILVIGGSSSSCSSCSRGRRGARPRRSASPIAARGARSSSASARMYAAQLRLFVGVGVLFVPIALLVTLLQALVLHATSVLGVQSGAEGGAELPRVRRARDRNVADAARGSGSCRRRRRGPSSRSTRGARSGRCGAYRLAFDSLRQLFGALADRRARRVAARGSIFLLPIAIWLAGPLGADRPRHRARRRLGPRRAAPQRAPRPRKVVQGRVADRRRRRARARARAVRRRATDPRGERCRSGS